MPLEFSLGGFCKQFFFRMDVYPGHYYVLAVTNN